MTKVIYILLSLITLNSVFGQSNLSKATGWTIASAPLFILDGKEVIENALKEINSENIESITVLKEEKAKSAYGEKAKNGVIIIVTKNISKSAIHKIQKLFAVDFPSNQTKRKIIISGTITDCEGNPLANVKIKNLNSNEVFNNDSDGSFHIICHKEDIISFKTLETKEERILAHKNNSKQIIKLSLKERSEEKSGNIMVKKPIIYLYPEKETDVHLQVHFKGDLLTTFPKYENGWNITAYPDGRIFDKTTKRFYNSLFWDGKRDFDSKQLNYSEGFIVAKKDLVPFLIEKLEHIGLNNSETNDFIQFWLPILEENEFNFIHFKTNDECNEISENRIEPKPETSIRVMMEFHKVDTPYPVKAQKLPKTKRKGFTLIEWGGAEIPQKSLKINL